MFYIPLFLKYCRKFYSSLNRFNKHWCFPIRDTVSDLRSLCIGMDLPAPRAFQDFHNLFDGLSHYVRGRHVNLEKERLGISDMRVAGLALVMQTTTGTLRARAIDKCSLDIPISPAFAPTIKMTQEGAPEVKP